MSRCLFDTRLGQVHCILAGEGASAPLLLLHQTPRSVDEYAEVLPLLARERRVIAMDTPGYGCSDRVPGQPSIADYAGAATDVLDALGIERATVVGHHTGAVIAVEMAAAFAARVDRVILSGPVYTDAAGRDELGRFFKQWVLAQDGSHLLDKWTRMHQWSPRPEPLRQAFSPCRVTSIEAGIFAANEQPERYAQAVLDYLRNPP